MIEVKVPTMSEGYGLLIAPLQMDRLIFALESSQAGVVRHYMYNVALAVSVLNNVIFEIEK